MTAGDMRPEAVRLPAGATLHAFETLDSTNEEAKRRARAGAPALTFVWAKRQTAGRGRRGRVWESPPGNLYASVLLRPACTPAEATQTGFLAAIAATEAIASLTVRPPEIRLKWPNDLLWRDAKIAGILPECGIGAGGRLEWQVLGLGLNLAHHPRGLGRAAADLAEAGVVLTPAAMLAAFADRLVDWLERWRREGFNPVRAAWLARAGGLGQGVAVQIAGARVTGRFIDLDPTGALVLDTGDGRRRVSAGEVFPVECV